MTHCSKPLPATSKATSRAKPIPAPKSNCLTPRQRARGSRPAMNNGLGTTAGLAVAAGPKPRLRNPRPRHPLKLQSLAKNPAASFAGSSPRRCLPQARRINTAQTHGCGTGRPRAPLLPSCCKAAPNPARPKLLLQPRQHQPHPPSDASASSVPTSLPQPQRRLRLRRLQHRTPWPPPAKRKTTPGKKPPLRPRQAACPQA